MNWTEGPATWKQLRFLKQAGYTPDHTLTKTEASDLIRNLGGNPESFLPPPSHDETGERNGFSPQQLREPLENARREITQPRSGPMDESKHAFDSAVTQRENFWIDTCRECLQMRVGSKHVLELYRKHGCLFHPPSREQVGEILRALDSAMATWDRDHPELFYETLALNFPGLLRHR